MPTLLLKNCDWVITQNKEREILPNSSILIEDNRIREIGQISPTADAEIDGTGKFVLPGLIDAHTNPSLALFRGCAEGVGREDWKKIWLLESKLNSEGRYYSTLLGSAEMIQSGTTTFVGTHPNLGDIAKAVNESGLRGFLSCSTIDPLDLTKSGAEPQNLQKSYEYVKQLANPRIRFTLGTHVACPAERLQWVKAFAEKNNLTVNVNVAETRHEQTQFQKQHGMRIVEYLDKIEVLFEKMLAVHCVWLTKSEVKLLARAQVKVAHCPVSNMKLANGGVAPLPEMFEGKIPVGLGTDGPASNNTLDMFETMKVCALIHKAHRWDPTVLNAQKVLDLATIEGATALRAGHEIGSLEVGKKADIILLNAKSPNLTPIHGKGTIVSDLVYSASARNVDTTIVDGKILMENRILKPINLNDVRTRTRHIASQLFTST